MRPRHLVLLGGTMTLAAACGAFDGAPAEATDDGGPPDAATTSMEADAATVDAGADAEPIDPAMLAWWRLDETAGTTASDALGKNPGTLRGGNWAAGKVGGAYATAGTGHVVVQEDASLTITKDFTLACWVSLGASQDDSYVYTHGFQFFLKLNGRRPHLSTGGAVYNLAYEVPENEWHHLAVTFSPGTARIYVDGMERSYKEGTVDAGTSISPDTGKVLIGANSSGELHAQGLIDDVRLYGRVLSPQEIAAIVAAAPK